MLLGGILAGGLAIVGAQLGPLLPVAALGVLAVMVLAVLRPLTAVYLAVLLIPLESLSSSVGSSFGLSPTEFVAVAAAGGWLVRRLVDQGGASFSSPLSAPLALLLVAHVPGLFLADDRFAVVKQLVMWGSFYILFLAVLTDRRADTSERLVTVIAAAGGAVAAIAVAKSAGSQQVAIGLGGDVTGRATGSFGGATLLGIFIASVLPLQFVLMLRGRAAWQRVGGTIATGLSLTALALAMTRSAFLAVAIVAGWLVIWWRPFRWFALAAVVLAGVVVLSGVNPAKSVVNTAALRDRIGSVTSPDTRTGQLRLKLWEGTPKMIEDNLPFGVGADNFVKHAPRYGLLGEAGAPYEHAHDVPLTIAAELGVLGLAAVLWLALALATTLPRALAAPREDQRALAVAMTAAFLALATDAVFDYTLSDNVFMLTVMLLAGITARLWRDAVREEAVAEPAPRVGRQALAPA